MRRAIGHKKIFYKVKSAKSQHCLHMDVSTVVKQVFIFHLMVHCNSGLSCLYQTHSLMSMERDRNPSRRTIIIKHWVGHDGSLGLLSQAPKLGHSSRVGADMNYPNLPGINVKNFCPVFSPSPCQIQRFARQWKLCHSLWLTDYSFWIGSKRSSTLTSEGAGSHRFSSPCTLQFHNHKIKFVNLIIPHLGPWWLPFTIGLFLHYVYHVQFPSWNGFSGFGPKEC